MNKSGILKNVVCSLVILIAMCVVCLKSSFAAQYEYDKLNRVTKVTYADGSYVEYTYDANGNIKSVKKVDGTPKQEEDVTAKPGDDSNTNPDSDNDDNKENESDKESSDDKDSNKEDGKENESDKKPSNDKDSNNDDEKENDKENDKEDELDKKPSNNVENKEDEKDKEKSKNKLNIFKPGSSHNTNPSYDSEFGIIYPKTIEEYLEEDMWFYEVVVKPSPLSKFDWLKYTYTLYFAQQDGVVDDEERKEFKKVLDKFEANKFYRDYIRFKEKLYALIRDEQ